MLDLLKDHQPPAIGQPRSQWPFFIPPLALLLLLIFLPPNRGGRQVVLEDLCFSVPRQWLNATTAPDRLNTAPVSDAVRDYLAQQQAQLSAYVTIEWVAESPSSFGRLFISVWDYRPQDDDKDIFTFVGQQTLAISRVEGVRIIGDARITLGAWPTRRIDFRRGSTNAPYRYVWLAIGRPLNKLIIIEGAEQAYHQEESYIGAWLQSFTSSC